MPKIENLPAGAAVITVRGLPLIVSEAVVATLIEANAVTLCGRCAFYHLRHEMELKMMAAALMGEPAALDLREPAPDVAIDPAVAEQIAAAMGKGAA